MKRRFVLLVAASLLGGTLRPSDLAAARKPFRIVKVKPEKNRPYHEIIRLRIDPFVVPPDRDREVCQYVEIPSGRLSAVCPEGAEAASCAVLLVGYDVRMGGRGASHHFILWSYAGTAAGADRFPPDLRDSVGCFDFGPGDTIATRTVVGSQTRRFRVRLPEGLAQPVPVIRDETGRPRGLGLILNSHFMGAGKRTRGRAEVRLYVARPGTVRARTKVILHGVASGLIHVPPNQVSDPPVAAYWGVTLVPPPPLPGLEPPPTADACVVSLTSHTYKRGVLFTTRLVDGGEENELFRTLDYTDPVLRTFDPPLRMNGGKRIRYECTHDNGVTTAVRMGCEVEPGVPPGNTGLRTYLRNRSRPDNDPGKYDGSARPCAGDGDCAGFGTGRCVPANLVFGYTSDDEMCILGGAYYDAIAGAPPGRECDVSLLPPA
jgi:hypothetical protein